MKRIFLILTMCLCITGLLPSQKAKADIDGGEPKYANALEYFESIGMGDGFREIYNENYKYLVEYSKSLNRYKIHVFNYDDLYANCQSVSFKVVRTSGEEMTSSNVRRYVVNLRWNDDGTCSWDYVSEEVVNFLYNELSDGTRRQFYGTTTFGAEVYVKNIKYSDLTIYSGTWHEYAQGTPWYYSDRKPVEEYIYFQTAQFDSVLDWLHYHGITCFDDYYDETKKYVVNISSYEPHENGSKIISVLDIREFDMDGYYISQKRWNDANTYITYNGMLYENQGSSFDVTRYCIRWNSKVLAEDVYKSSHSYLTFGAGIGNVPFVYCAFPMLYSDFPIYDIGFQTSWAVKKYSTLSSLANITPLYNKGFGVAYSYAYNMPSSEYYLDAPLPTMDAFPMPTPTPTPTPTPVIDLPDIDIGDIGISESKYQVTQEGIWFNDVYYAYDLEMRNFILDRDLQGYAVFYEKENNTLSVYWMYDTSALIADFGLENGIYYMMVTDKTTWCMCQYTVNDDGTLTEKTAFCSHLDGFFIHIFFLHQYGNMENEDLLSEYISKCINEGIVYSTVDILFTDKSMCRNCDTGGMDWSYILNDIGSAVVEDWKSSWEETLQKIYEYIEIAKNGINDIYRAIKEVSAEGNAPTITVHFDDFYGLNGDYEVLNFLWLLPYINLVHLFLGVTVWISTIIWLVNYIPKLLGGIA